MSSSEKMVGGPQQTDLQRLANLLSETQALLGVGAWELDVLQGRVLWTEEVYHLHGVTPDEFNPNLGDALAFYHPDDRKSIEDAVLKAAGSGMPYTVTARIIRPDGETRHVKTSGKAEVKSGNVVRVYGLIQDITELRIAEKNLLESGGLTASLIAAMQEGFSVLNSERMQVSVNPAFCKMTGYSEEELVGAVAPFPYWPEECYDEIRHAFTQEPYPGMTLNLTFRRKNEQRFRVQISPSKVFNEHGDLVAYFATVRDIDKEEETRRQLDETLYQLQKTTNSVPGAIFQLNRHAPREIWVSYLSDGIRSIIPDLTPEVITSNQSEGLTILLGVDQSEAILDMLERSAENMEPFSQSLTFELPSGTKQIQVDAQPEQLPDGGITWFGYAQDVTELQQQNMMLENLVKMTTQQNNRLLSFAQIVSHNVRSHASNIIGLIDILRESDSESEKQLMLEMLGETGLKLDDTIRNLNEILTINRDTNPSREMLRLRGEIDRVVDLLSDELHRHLAIVKVEVPESLMVYTVPAYLDSILLNLFSNAIKYRSVKRRLEIRVEARMRNKEVELRVTDNGQGIDLEKYGSHIFGMYRTFHGNEDARGLGLFLMKNQIEAMGGSVHVESEPDKGSTFIVHFT